MLVLFMVGPHLFLRCSPTGTRLLLVSDTPNPVSSPDSTPSPASLNGASGTEGGYMGVSLQACLWQLEGSILQVQQADHHSQHAQPQGQQQGMVWPHLQHTQSQVATMVYI